jgi:hypothetical protein
MKKIIIIMVSMTLSLGAFAQHKVAVMPHSHPHRSHIATHIYVTPVDRFGFGYDYPYFGYPNYGFYPYPYYNYMPMSAYNLNRQVTSIRSEYSYKIKAVRKDKSIVKSQRKQQILALKSEREKAIASAENSFYQRRLNYRNGLNNSQSPKTNENQNPSVDNNNQGS